MSLVFVALTVALGSRFIASCDDNKIVVAAPPPPTPDPIGDDDDAGASCVTCVSLSCGREESACKADIACAPKIACINACTGAAEGNTDPACVAACLEATPQAAPAFDIWDACRKRESPLCASCGGSAANGATAFQAAILNQQCKGKITPDYDIGECSPPPFQESEAELKCKKCMSERCCDTKTKCARDRDCNMVRACIVPRSTCSDGGTNEFGTCYERFPNGQDLFNANFACQAVRCVDDCTITKTPCSTCTIERCGDAYAATFSTHNGPAYGECAGSCKNDTACATACRDKYPALREVYAHYVLCLTERCGDVCF